MILVNKADFFHPTAWLDERTFEVIFHEHYTQVYAILFRLTGDQYEADDLAAETFWRLWERPPAKAENIGGWLYRVATRQGYNALRANRRRSQYEADAAASAGEESGASVGNSTTDPAKEVEQRSERQRVRSVLRKLPLRDVQVLVLRHSGVSYKEIAAALSIAPGSVGTLLARAEDRFEALYSRGDQNAPER